MFFTTMTNVCVIAQYHTSVVSVFICSVLVTSVSPMKKRLIVVLTTLHLNTLPLNPHTCNTYLPGPGTVVTRVMRPNRCPPSGVKTALSMWRNSPNETSLNSKRRLHEDGTCRMTHYLLQMYYYWITGLNCMGLNITLSTDFSAKGNSSTSTKSTPLTVRSSFQIIYQL